MKKIIAVLAACVLLAGCNGRVSIPNDNVMFEDGESMSAVSVPKGGNGFYVEEAIKLSRDSGYRLNSPAYIECTRPPAEYLAEISCVKSIPYSDPKSVKIIHINEKELMKCVEEDGGRDDVLRTIGVYIDYEYSLGQTLVNRYNAGLGPGVIGATAMLAKNRGFVKPEDFESEIIVYLEYPTDYSSAVCFYEYGENVINAYAMFVKNDNGSFDEMIEMVDSEFPDECVTVEEVEEW